MNRPSLRPRALFSKALVLGPLLVGALMTSCSDKPATAIVISVSSEARTPKEIDKLRITVQRDGDDRFLQTYEFDPTTRSLPGTLTVSNDPEKDPTGTLIIRVEATRGSVDTPWKMIRESRLGFSKEKTKLLRMPLRYACWENPCTKPGETCRGGECVSTSINIDGLDDFAGNQTQIKSAKKDVAGVGCFNPSFCLAPDKLKPVKLDDACSFPLSADIPPETLNVSMTWLDIAPDNPVPVEPNNADEGYTEHLGRITLSKGLCKAVADGRASIGVSSACPAKRPDEPVCVVTDAPQSCTATISINEVNQGDGQQQPYIELYNSSTDCEANLDGFTMQYYAPGSNGPTLLWTGKPGDVAAAKGWFMITLSPGTLTGTGGLYLYARQPESDSATTSLSPTDTIAWGTFANPPIGYGETAPATDLMPGMSLGRVPDGHDTNDNSKDFALVTPSPGTSNGGASGNFKEQYLLVMSAGVSATNKTVVAIFDPADGSWPLEPVDKSAELGLSSKPQLATLLRSDGSMGALLVGAMSTASFPGSPSAPAWATFDNGSFSSPAAVPVTQQDSLPETYSLVSLGTSALMFDRSDPMATPQVETIRFDGAAFETVQPVGTQSSFFSGVDMVGLPSGDVTACGIDGSGILSLTTFKPGAFAWTPFAANAPTAVDIRPTAVLDSSLSPLVFYVDSSLSSAAVYSTSDALSITLDLLPSSKRVSALQLSDNSFLTVALTTNNVSGQPQFAGWRGTIGVGPTWTPITQNPFVITSAANVVGTLSDPVMLPSSAPGVDAEIFVVLNGSLKHFQLSNTNTATPIITEPAVPDSASVNSQLGAIAAVKVRVAVPLSKTVERDRFDLATGQASCESLDAQGEISYPSADENGRVVVGSRVDISGCVGVL